MDTGNHRYIRLMVIKQKHKTYAESNLGGKMSVRLLFLLADPRVWLLEWAVPNYSGSGLVPANWHVVDAQGHVQVRNGIGLFCLFCFSGSGEWLRDFCVFTTI